MYIDAVLEVGFVVRKGEIREASKFKAVEAAMDPLNSLSFHYGTIPPLG